MSEEPFVRPILGSRANQITRANAFSWGRFWLGVLIVFAVVFVLMRGCSAAIDHVPERDPAVSAVIAREEADLARMADRYLVGLREAGNAELLSPASIAHDPSLKRSSAQLAKIVELDSGYFAAIEARRLAARGELERTLNGRRRENALIAYDTARSDFDLRVKAAKDLRGQVYVELDALIDLLTKAKGRWAVRGDRVIFARRAELEAYNLHAGNARALNVRLEGLKQPSTVMPDSTAQRR